MTNNKQTIYLIILSISSWGLISIMKMFSHLNKICQKCCKWGLDWYIQSINHYYGGWTFKNMQVLYIFK